uniref:Putative coagulation serine protease n=1 Tax=Ciona intestinalis TaxID=7719 RepID=Q8T3A0_CIOIN|nr:sp4 protein precursor [Ciona intestinalis]CAD24309.1 putative coagulation serine protease [Ciona intestinalis]
MILHGSWLLLIFCAALIPNVSQGQSSVCSTSLGCVDCFSWCQANAASCTSSPALMGSYCKKTCNLCASNSAACIAKGCNHRCIETTGSEPVCACFEGFRLEANGRTCVDIDECAENSTLCSDPNLPNCNNTLGHYVCTACGSTPNRHAYYERNECCKMSGGACGKSSTNGGRIVGGKRGRIARWPWMAYIVIGRNLCGGTLLSSGWVLTAAHCFASITNNNPSTINVILGVVDTIDSGNIHEQSFSVTRLIIHPNYNFPNNDLALLQLDHDALIDAAFVKPVCLPNGEEPPEGEKCWATGYGTIAFGGVAAKSLQEVDLPIADLAHCERIYANLTNRVNRTTMLCAGYITGQKDTCQGDSGGPLVCQRCKNCDWYLAGTTSFGRGCARPGFFGVYTKVSFFEQWISSYTSIAINPGQCVKPSWTTWGSWTPCASCSGSSSRIRFCANGSPGDPGCDGLQEEFRQCSTVCTQPTWAEYGDWGSCSVTCGDGSRSRSRICRNGNIGDPGCPTGGETATEACTTGVRCPTWSAWSGYGVCSVTCGGGTQESTRTCNNHGQAGVTCDGRDTRSQACNPQTCPAPTWAAYGAWSDCTRQCGGGERTRVRTCLNGAIGSSGCPAAGVSQTESCNIQSCQANPTWSAYGSWSGCSVTCASGTRTRSRSCVGGNIGNVGCESGGQTASEACTTGVQCPTWSAWSVYGVCSVTCGGGTQESTRTCNNHGQVGVTCDGRDTRSQACNPQACPSWSGYGSWSGCSETCGDGTKTRTRTCNNGQIGDNGCSPAAAATDSMACSVRNCPQWSSWGSWGQCSLTCGSGTRTAVRQCNTFGATGASCGAGATSKSEPCNLGACPVFSAWSGWSTCSAGCGGGQQTRTRTCSSPGNCDPDAFGTALSGSQACNTDACIGEWGVWVNSGTCSAACGPGTIQQTRECIGGTAGQPNCVGSTQQTAACNVAACTWGEWVAWTACTVTCGAGTQTRSRTCSGEAGRCPGGQSAATESQACAASTCASTVNDCSNDIDLAPAITCREYAVAGYCEQYKDYMDINCIRSCCVFGRNPCSMYRDSLFQCPSYRHLCTNTLVEPLCKYTCNCV